MARPLQDRSRAEPTAAASGSPAVFPVGGTMAPPPPRCPAPPRLTCGQRCVGQEPPEIRGHTTGSDASPTTPLGGGSQEPLQRVAPEANGHLHGTASLEEEIGARLRHLGDQFHQEEAQRRQELRGLQGALWGHLHHFVFHLLGIFYNLPAEGVADHRPH